jgi:HK97 family phage prohead protease
MDFQPARDDLCRSVTFRAAETEDPQDGRTLDGYGAVFNSPTRIDSWEGCFDETIAPGAFKKSLREGMPRMQFDHGHHPLIGSIPIGRFDVVEEDTHGLHVVGRLSDNWLIEPVRMAIADGGIDGMSFRFSVIREEWSDSDGKVIRKDSDLWMAFEAAREDPAKAPTRMLKEVRCTEVGPVVWPAYSDTSVGVRDKKFVVDLGSRESLARAAFVIDAAVRNTGDVGASAKDVNGPQDAPISTDEDAARHSATEPTDTSSQAGDHSSEPVEDSLDRKARIRARNRENAAILSAIKNGEPHDGR